MTKYKTTGKCPIFDHTTIDSDEFLGNLMCISFEMAKDLGWIEEIKEQSLKEKLTSGFEVSPDGWYKVSDTEKSPQMDLLICRVITEVLIEPSAFEKRSAKRRVKP